MYQKKQDVDTILESLDIDQLNEMQKATLEASKQAQDLVLLSATGSGKTLAFLLAILENLNPDKPPTQAMIIVPSRELAQQIESVCRSMKTGLKITACYGGHLRETEENNLKQPPDILVGTPGRIADHIRRGNITKDLVSILVLDEFDKSLEMGFEEEMSFIIGSLPNISKRILTSATETINVPGFVQLREHLRLNFLDPEGLNPPALAIEWVSSPDKDKIDSLFRLICHLGNRSMIVFCNHRESVERTNALLREKGIYSEFYHGAMEQRDRDSALSKFRNGTTSILVTTDLAARGLDIPNIRYIIHYHLPQTEDIFTHRNGRTARMDASGTAILILSEEEKMPSYITEEPKQIQLEDSYTLPDKPKWSTIFIAAGKKDKVNKVDIVGFLSKKGELKKEDIGLIEVKDFFSFVAVRKVKVSNLLQTIKNEKIKNQKVKIEVAK